MISRVNAWFSINLNVLKLLAIVLLGSWFVLKNHPTSTCENHATGLKIVLGTFAVSEMIFSASARIFCASDIIFCVSEE